MKLNREIFSERDIPGFVFKTLELGVGENRAKPVNRIGISVENLWFSVGYNRSKSCGKSAPVIEKWQRFGG